MRGRKPRLLQLAPNDKRLLENTLARKLMH